MGGLDSAYQYCPAADYVLPVKATSPWERDAKVVDELERALDRDEFGAIVVHLLGLDDGKDRGLPTDGAMLVFRRQTKAVRIRLDSVPVLRLAARTASRCSDNSFKGWPD